MPVDNYPEGSHSDPNAPWNDEPTEGPMWCSTCEAEAEHERNYRGEWHCRYEDMHLAAHVGLERYVWESIVEAFRRARVPLTRGNKRIAHDVAAMAENHVPDVMDAES